MNGKPVRWGILGASQFAREQMGPAIHASHGTELVALGTSNATNAAGFEAFCPSLKIYTSYNDLLADPQIDAVYIPLPNHLHVEWSIKALEAGKHVLTEKPIALNATEIDRLIQARDASGLVAAEAYMIVHHPQWIRARELVQGGAIGRVLDVDCAFSFDIGDDHGNIRLRPETAGGGIRDLGVYTYGSVRFVTGAEPLVLTARFILENGVDTWAQVTGTMAGPLGAFTYSATTAIRQFPRQEIVFVGEKGLLRVGPAPFNANVFAQSQIELHGPGFSITTERYPGVNHYKLQVEAFGRTVREGVPYPCPLEFTRGTQAMIDRVFEVGKPFTV
jgi:predicted dehydrogenase